MRANTSPVRGLILSALFAAAACALFVQAGKSLAAGLWREEERMLRSQVILMAEAIGSDLEGMDPQEAQARVQRLGRATGTRFTLIRPDGTVLADSEAPPARMDNHGTRAEVVASLSEEFSSSRRFSTTLGVESLYVAKTLRRDDVVSGWIRASVHLQGVSFSITPLQWALVGMTTLALVASSILAAFTTSSWLRSKRAVAK